MERIQRLSDAPLTDCPACEKPGLKRLISAAAFRFKGGGWYETDFKKENQRNLADSGNEAPKPAESADAKDGISGSGQPADVKSDSKSDTKSETKKASDTGSKSETKTASQPDSTPAKSGAA